MQAVATEAYGTTGLVRELPASESGEGGGARAGSHRRDRPHRLEGSRWSPRTVRRGSLPPDPRHRCSGAVERVVRGAARFRGGDADFDLFARLGSGNGAFAGYAARLAAS